MSGARTNPFLTHCFGRVSLNSPSPTVLLYRTADVPDVRILFLKWLIKTIRSNNIFALLALPAKPSQPLIP